MHKLLHGESILQWMCLCSVRPRLCWKVYALWCKSLHCTFQHSIRCILSFIISVAPSDSYEIIKSETCKVFNLAQTTDWRWYMHFIPRRFITRTRFSHPNSYFPPPPYSLSRLYSGRNSRLLHGCKYPVITTRHKINDSCAILHLGGKMAAAF